MNRADGVSTFHANNGAAWRKWLEENHAQASSVWLVIYRKGSDTPSVCYDEAVDEALCFGWIDSKPNKRESESYYQFFSKRSILEWIFSAKKPETRQKRIEQTVAMAAQCLRANHFRQPKQQQP